MLRFLAGKLVRDKVIQEVEGGEQWQYRALQGDELKRALIAKLKEEADEIPVRTEKDAEVIDELADVQEVLDALKAAYAVETNEVKEIQARKNSKKGGFKAGYYVEAVEMPEDNPWVDYFRKNPSYSEQGRPKSIACSYAFTGEDRAVVERRMGLVRDELLTYTDKVYCNLFDPDVEKFTTNKEFISEAVKKLAGYDALLVIVTSERRSEGMLIEVGTALARGQELIVAQHTSAVDKSYLPELADESFVWETDSDLLRGIQNLFAE